MIIIKKILLLLTICSSLVACSLHLDSTFVHCEENVGGLEDYDSTNVKEEAKNILNEFVAEQTNESPTNPSDETVWDGSAFLSGKVEYTEVIQKQKEEEMYNRIASLFEGTAFVLDLEKFKETGTLEGNVTTDYSKIWESMLENKETYFEMFDMLLEELEKAKENEDLMQFLEEMLEWATSQGDQENENN